MLPDRNRSVDSVIENMCYDPATIRGEASMTIWRGAAVAALLSLLVVAFCVTYITFEQPVYIWDLSGYWHLFQQVGDLAARGDREWAHFVLATAQAADYNATPVVPLLPVYYLFGGSRSAYVSGVAVLYLLPTVAIVACVARMALGERGALPFWAVFLLALFFIPFWYPTLRGYLDIIGLICLAGATWLLFRSNFLRRQTVRTGLLIGLCLWSAFLFRRWYAFSVVAFFGAATAASFIEATVGDRSDLKKRLLQILGGLFLAGALALGLIYVFQAEFVGRVLRTSYADAYDAYQIPLFEHLSDIAGWLTPLGLVAAAVGLLSAVRFRNERLLFCFVGAVITYVLFIRTQRLGAHHFLPVAMWSFVLVIAGYNEVVRIFQGKSRKIAYISVITGASVIFAVSLTPWQGRLPAIAATVLPKPDLRPLRIRDYEHYAAAASKIEASLRPNDRLILFASSFELSDSLLAEIRPSLRSRIDFIDHVDKFKMFTFDLLRANVVLAVSPDQTHLPPTSQQTVTVPNRMLLEHRGIGRAFEFERTYDLPTMRISQFRRVRNVTADEAADLLDIFAKTYPTWPAAYKQTLVIPMALRAVSQRAPWGHGELASPQMIQLHPDAAGPTSVMVPFHHRLGAIPAAVMFRLGGNSGPSCSTSDGVAISVTAAGQKVWSGDLTNQEPKRVVLPEAPGDVAISIDKRGNEYCDLTFATFEIGEN